MSDETNRIARLEAEEAELVLDGFDQSDALALGMAMAQKGAALGHPIAIDIRTRGLVLFHASLPGATEDNDAWAARKSATVLRFESSTALLGTRFAARGADPLTGGWLDPARYTLAGGSFPVRVRRVGVVAAVTVSGLVSDEDHAFVVDALRAHLSSD